MTPEPSARAEYWRRTLRLFAAPVIPDEERPTWLEPGTIAALTSPDAV